MFGPRVTRVFRSRRHTLWWAASVLLTAYCTVPARQAGAPRPSEHCDPAATARDPWTRHDCRR